MEQQRQNGQMDTGRGRLTVGMVAATVVAALLVGALLWWSANKQSVYEKRFASQLAAGNFDTARDLASLLDGDAEEQVNYAEARSLYAAGAYEEAETLFQALGSYQDAAEQASACHYARADALAAQGEYAAAEALFADIPGYADAMERGSACRYALAEEACAAGDMQLAFTRFLSLGSYQDAADRAGEIAIAITGEQDGTRALAIAQGYDEAQWETLQALDDAREALGTRHLATGWKHAVVLNADGTVSAWGDDTCGQCGVSAWRDVTAVAAGAHFTLGLCADGTVLACGDNGYGQCEVSGWTDIVAIYAGDYDAYGLKADGTLVHTGYYDGGTDGWAGVACFAAGNCCVAAVSADGTVLCSFLDGSMEAQSSACDVAVNLGWTAVLHRDGTVTSDTVQVSDWQEVTRLTCSSTVLAGERLDGTLEVLALMRGGEKLATALRSVRDVSEIALSGGWALVLHTDGTVETIGETDLMFD